MYELIGCECIDACRPFGPCEVLYVDDEGMLKDPPLPSFLILGYPHALYGRGLVLGFRKNGESRSTRLTLADLDWKIAFKIP
jgi:hypothetical protein